MALSYTFPIKDKYFITSPFGSRTAPTAGASTNHQGVDISVPVGTNVYAAAAGTITKSGYSSARGNYVEINHGNGNTTLYQHLSKAVTKIGDTVKQGQVIAKSGNSGISTGPHLHFEMRQNGKAVNPLVGITANETTAEEGILSNVNTDSILDFIKEKWWLIAGGLVLVAVLK
ncbi:MAG: M23 family metallopeptidase [Clostridiales bacterium]|jgi:murein DD-endopeptidase MepM/ murein hydrolase activator NlpD|nr:M23 family metallopeptidase [Clostridiales bacterium]